MIVGREKEIELLKGLLEEEDSQFVAIYGRRRVGKTFLIREAFNYSFAFQHTGIYGASLKEQLSEFTESLYSAGMRKVKNLPSNWNEAFHLLERFIEKSKKAKTPSISLWIITPFSILTSSRKIRIKTNTTGLPTSTQPYTMVGLAGHLSVSAYSISDRLKQH